jgi:hypothetical protein
LRRRAAYRRTWKRAAIGSDQSRLEISMNYRWMPTAAAALGFVGLTAIAKDSAPWPLYILLALATVACAGMTMVIHSRGRPPRAELPRLPPSN